ncbi:MAG: hypothetical protein IJ631_05670 [Schwartzia sp.]|nr:hypothetical protein [Schwartzia sp. (in: firmicutes)]
MSDDKHSIPMPNHSRQVLKMDILGMIHSAENPFDIINHIANYLEKESNEAGYAQTVRDNLRTVYGVVLGDKKLLTDELKDVEARLARIEESCKANPLTEEELTRANFAITLHKKNIERIKTRIQELTANEESLYFIRQ